ncbi:hypothetical protein [Occultella glacieicola]|uniref:hypothetical protein n=1 Tax=Occultella glacieicola TaxID=2518684 RepID=UPI001A9F14CE|nr:hypothetical protein [Occultella glacieicola]
MSERGHEQRRSEPETVELWIEELAHLDLGHLGDEDDDLGGDDDDLWDYVDDDVDDDDDYGDWSVPDVTEPSAATSAGVHVPMPGPGVAIPDDAALLAVLTTTTSALIVEGSPSVWCFVMDGRDTMTDLLLLLGERGQRPERAHLDRLFAEFREAAQGPDRVPASLVIAIARPDGGDRGGYERLWHTAVTAAATRHQVTLRAVAALGSRRASLL